MLISIKDLSARYDRTDVFRNISLDLSETETILITGPNGCGKSTLLKAILGLVPHTEGSILFKNKEISRCKTNSIVKMGIGYAPQHQGLFYGMTVLENLQLAADRNHGTIAFGNKLETILAEFPMLESLLTVNAGLLSGGEQKLGVLAACLLGDPKVLFLDEPLMGLSQQAAQIVLQKLERLSKGGVPMVVVEHKVTSIQDLCNRVFQMASDHLLPIR